MQSLVLPERIDYNEVMETDKRFTRYAMMEKDNLYEQLLLETAAWDEMTNVASRRSGKAKLERKLSKAREENKTVTVAMYDVNGLQAVNEQYGRAEGDRVLRFLAEITKKNLDEQDYIFRLSSDEFIVVFYGKNRGEADSCMKRIQEQAKEESGQFTGQIQARFCYGLKEIYPEENTTVSDIISEADDQMYRQKKQYHILRAQQDIETMAIGGMRTEEFEYDKEHLYEALTEGTDDYIFVGNMKTGIFRYPPAMVAEFGLPGEIVENAAAFWGKLIHPHDEKEFLESNQEIADGRAEHHDIRYRARNVLGEWIWLRCRGKMVRDTNGEPVLFAGMISNLGKRDQIDHMTGLLNRFKFEGDIKKYLVDHENVKSLGIMILDMDAFRNINDLYNRSFGDEILRITAQRIAAMLPAEAQAYRLDGDEFGIIVVNGSAEVCSGIYDKIQKKYRKQQEYMGKKYYCTLSCGSVCYPQNADTYLDLMKFANYSLEASKSAGKNRNTVFTIDILEGKERKLRLTELLRESVEKGFVGFSVHYQPQIDARTRELYGAEALARWQCPQFGAVPPFEFIPILEETGMIIPFGGWIFKKAAEQCKKWCQSKADLHMSINLSYLQLLEGDIVSFVYDTLDDLALSPANITLELTETYLVKADRDILDMLCEMRSRGILIAMDDFGVGYSSLYTLKNIPVDVVKIDKGFAKDIIKDLFSVTFVRSITELCHNVGKFVCLEGVETEPEYTVVKETGLELIQGYYFGRPVPPDKFEQSFLPIDKLKLQG